MFSTLCVCSTFYNYKTLFGISIIFILQMKKFRFREVTSHSQSQTANNSQDKETNFGPNECLVFSFFDALSTSFILLHITFCQSFSLTFFISPFIPISYLTNIKHQNMYFALFGIYGKIFIFLFLI